MQNNRSIEIGALTVIILIAGILFVSMIVYDDVIPVEYRNTSPGFGWSWDFDYEAGMREAGRFGAEPWPWSAKINGSHLVLPLNKSLFFKGLEITYRGMPEPGFIQLDFVIQSLDSSFTYQQNYEMMEAERGFTIADRRFTLEKIYPRYLRLRSISP